jgi:hypothetical protein
MLPECALNVQEKSKKEKKDKKSKKSKKDKVSDSHRLAVLLLKTYLSGSLFTTLLSNRELGKYVVKDLFSEQGGDMLSLLLKLEEFHPPPP